ncbi:MAG: hypothetical protein A2Y25_04370 [Candidatus Melainabacteria bacterium GWF2_37_15]|nr:MAG: hypothetical protein A2Y25_04370 [Candidatus Melainabacteria bacterium GWF2_37_15]
MNIPSLIFLISRIAVILMLFWATSIHPYSYYILLRCVVFIVAGYTTFKFYKHNKPPVKYLGMLVFAAIFVLFNPVFVVHLNQQSLWVIIDIITGILFALSFIFI